MFYHFLAPEGGHPTWEENSLKKIIVSAEKHLSNTHLSDLSIVGTCD